MRLEDVYLDSHKTRDDYLREKKALEDKLDSLVVPGVDTARKAGTSLEDLPTRLEEANLAERKKLLLTMLDAVYIETVEGKAIVAIRPKTSIPAALRGRHHP